MNIILFFLFAIGVFGDELLISKTYEAEDLGLDLLEHPQCKAWKLWKRTREETIDLSADDIDLLASRRQLLRITDKKTAKLYSIPEELRANYSTISINFRSICELNARVLTIQTARAANKYGIDVELLCQKNTSSPDLSEISIFDGEYVEPLPAKYRIAKRNLLTGQDQQEIIVINSTSEIPDRIKGLDIRVFEKHQSVVIDPNGVCGKQSEIDGIENLQYYQEKYGHLSFDISVLGEKIEALMSAQQDIDRLDNIMEKFEAFNKNEDRPFPSSQIIPWLKKVKYDNRSPPVLFQDDRVIVKMGLHIQSMSNFELSTMDFDMDVWLRMCWMDPRLRHSFSRPVLINDYNTLKKIWRPDPMFKNAKSAAFHKVTYLNFYMYIFPEGEVFMDIRVFLKPTTAQIVLCKYPHDTPACSLRISSRQTVFNNLKSVRIEPGQGLSCFGLGIRETEWHKAKNHISVGFTHDVVQFEWFSRDSDAIRLNSNMQIPELVIEDYRPVICDGHRKSGNYSCLEVLFKMSREIGYHVAHTYIPTAICVIFSMVSVWLPEEFVEGRIFVSLTVFLTLSAESNSAKEELPKAIDIWFGFTSIFVFFTMIQALFVICLEHESRKLKKKAESHIDDYSTHQIAKMLLRSRYYHKLGRKLDAFFKVMYPVIFLIFLIIYGFVITQGDEKKCLPDNLV